MTCQRMNDGDLHRRVEEIYVQAGGGSFGGEMGPAASSSRFPTLLCRSFCNPMRLPPVRVPPKAYSRSGVKGQLSTEKIRTSDIENRSLSFVASAKPEGLWRFLPSGTPVSLLKPPGSRWRWLRLEVVRRLCQLGHCHMSLNRCRWRTDTRALIIDWQGIGSIV